MNLNPQETIEQIQRLGRELAETNEDYMTLAAEYAIAEADYQVAITKTAYRLKDEGIPTTLIPHMLKGDEQVAPLFRDYNLKKALMDAQKKKLNSLENRISIGQSSLNWLKIEYNASGQE